MSTNGFEKPPAGEHTGDAASAKRSAAAATAEPSGNSSSSSSSSSAPATWGTGLEEVQKTLKAAGQQILEGSAEFAEKGRQFMSQHFGGVLAASSGADEHQVPLNSTKELLATSETSFQPKSDCVFLCNTGELVFSVDLPSFEKKDVDVVVDSDVLTISGCRKAANYHTLADPGAAAVSDKEQLQQIIQERKLGSFMRRFKLPPNADQEEITAAMEHGVLEVRVKCKADSHVPEEPVKAVEGENDPERPPGSAKKS